MGFDYNFVDSPDMNFICPVCCCVLEIPVIACKEGHVFCEECISTVKKCNTQNPPRCPLCKNLLLKHFVRSRAVQSLIATLKIRCPHFNRAFPTLPQNNNNNDDEKNHPCLKEFKNEERLQIDHVSCKKRKREEYNNTNRNDQETNILNGCNWIGTLESLSSHLQSCMFQLVKCPNGCTPLEGLSCYNSDSDDCDNNNNNNNHGENRATHSHSEDKCMEELNSITYKKTTKLLRGEIPQHLLTCPNRIVKCKFCKIEISLRDQKFHQREECLERIVSCSNEGCKFRNKRRSLLKHQILCKYATVVCSFEEIGCRSKFKRCESSSHYTDNLNQHLLMLAQNFVSLREEVKLLNYQILSPVRNTFDDSDIHNPNSPEDDNDNSS